MKRPSQPHAKVIDFPGLVLQVHDHRRFVTMKINDDPSRAISRKSAAYIIRGIRKNLAEAERKS